MTGPDHELVTEIHVLLDNIDKISAWLNRAESLLVEEKYDESEERIGEWLSHEFADMEFWMLRVIDKLEDHFQ